MFFIIIIISIQLSIQQQQLKQILYNINGQPANSQTINHGYFGQTIRLSPQDGSKFKEEFIISSSTPIYPQFPVAKLNQLYTEFQVGASSTQAISLSIKLSNSTYYSSPTLLSLSVNTSPCIIVPQADFKTILANSQRNVILDFTQCLPIESLQVKASYGTITRTLTMTSSKQYLIFEILAGNNAVGTQINISFSANSFYTINPITLSVISASNTIPVVTLTKSSTDCVKESIQINVKCSTTSIFYYAYYYLIEPSLQTIIDQVGYVKISTKINGMEGYGYLNLEKDVEKSLTLSNLRSTTTYNIVGYCIDEYNSQSIATYLQFSKCDSQLLVNKLIMSQQYKYTNQQLKSILCTIVLQLSLNIYQVSTNNGLYCDSIAQWKYNKYTETLEQLNSYYNYTILIYPIYYQTTQHNYTKNELQNFNIIEITQYSQYIPAIKQEFISGANGQLNITLSLQQDGFIYISLDAINPKQPLSYQLIQGMNGNNELLIQSQQSNMTASLHQTFNFLVNDNMDYNIYYLIGSDPEYYGDIILRKYSQIKQTD